MCFGEQVPRGFLGFRRIFECVVVVVFPCMRSFHSEREGDGGQTEATATAKGNSCVALAAVFQPFFSHGTFFHIEKKPHDFPKWSQCSL